MIWLAGLNQAVRVFRRVKSAHRSSHVSLYVVENVSGCRSEKGIVGDLVSVQEEGFSSFAADTSGKTYLVISAPLSPRQAALARIVRHSM